MKKIAKVAVGKSTGPQGNPRARGPGRRLALLGGGVILSAMRVRLGSSGRPLLLAVVLAALALGPAAGSASAYRVTFIGDSKAAMIEYSAKAKRVLARGYTMRRDLRVCRRLVRPSCEYQNVRPLTALEAINHYGNGLGRVLVIDVGYNDHSGTYKSELNRVMRAALGHGVRGVVWVNLRTVRADYTRINAIIRKAPNRWPQLYVANWNKYSSGHPSWFSPQINDGIHLTTRGAVNLVRLVRRYIPVAAQGARQTAPPPVLSGLPGGIAPGAGSSSPSGETTANETPGGGAVATTSSPPVGHDLGGSSDSSTGPSSVLAFAGGAVLMLFLVLVTLRRRRAA
jgi:hypothetical protein